MLTPSDDRLHRLPKAELHVHLDGSLRPSTMIDLAEEAGVRLPTTDEQELGGVMLVDDAASLEDYLARFQLTVALMQRASAIERVAYELALDNAAENVRYLEVRFCPGLCTNEGLSPDAVLEAALAGLERASRDADIEAAVIVSALRSLPPTDSLEMAELAVRYSERGVCAFDVAGAEAGYPARDHARAIRHAVENGLAVTLHAGEGYGVASIRQALKLGARRIGHGTRLFEDPDLLGSMGERGVPLEVCITSNVQTRVSPSYAEHPARRYVEEGVRVCLCTDNRLMSGVTLTDEYAHARDALGFGWDDLVALARVAFSSAFASDAAKRRLGERFEREVGRLDADSG